MKNKTYQVWTEDKNGNESEVLFQGTKTAAYKYFKSNGGSKAELHIGYLL